MKKFLFATAIILGLCAFAPRAVAGDHEISYKNYESALSGGGSNCAPTDLCCQCKAPCISKYNEDVKSCGLTGPAATDCVAEALSAETRCLNDCTINDKCQDA
jgi:hypothetical protein